MAGTWLGPFVTRGGVLQTSDALVAIMFAGVLLMNLGVISLYDIHLDSRLGIGSLAHTLGKNGTRNLLVITGIAIYLLLILQFLVFGLDPLFPVCFDPVGNGHHPVSGAVPPFFLQKE